MNIPDVTNVYVEEHGVGRVGCKCQDFLKMFTVQPRRAETRAGEAGLKTRSSPTRLRLAFRWVWWKTLYGNEYESAFTSRKQNRNFYKVNRYIPQNPNGKMPIIISS